MQQIRYVDYQCQRCEVFDTMKLFLDEVAPAVINCWNCHAGFQKSQQEMMAGDAMFRVQNDPLIVSANHE